MFFIMFLRVRTRTWFSFFFHVYRFQNLRIDHELLVPCKYILSQMSQICDMYIYIFIHNRNSRWHGSKFLKVTRSVDFFLPRLGTHRHRLNQMDLALSTHTHWQSPVEWWNVARPFSISTFPSVELHILKKKITRRQKKRPWWYPSMCQRLWNPSQSM